MATPWVSSAKRVLALAPVGHASDFVAPPAFDPPRAPESFEVQRLKLHAAMARTGLAANADNLLLQWRAAAASAEVDHCIDELTEGLVLSKDLLAVTGAERTAIVGRIGAGMCDLYMQSLGYVWRDQAEHQLAVRGPLADFIYEGPPTQGLGVALVEAKGSTMVLSRMRAQDHVNRAYHRQVEVHLGAATDVGQVIHGYAVGLRAGIGKLAYMCVAETERLVPIARDSEPDKEEQASRIFEAETGEAEPLEMGAVSLSTALGNYATILALAGEPRSARVLLQVRTGASSPQEASELLFELLQDQVGGYIQGAARGGFSLYTGIRYAVRVEPIHQLAHELWRMKPDTRGGAQRIELPILRQIVAPEGEPGFVLFPDGLAGFGIARDAALDLEARLPVTPIVGRQSSMTETWEELLQTRAEAQPEPSRLASKLLKYTSSS